MNSPAPKVLYEDEWMIVINKEAGHLVHAADEPQPGDIVSMKLVREWVGSKIFCTHRLDRPTCGTLLFAKTKTAARALNRAFERKQVRKSYRAVVAGRPPENEWTCAAPLQKEEGQPWREAATTFRILRSWQGDFTLLEATPLTGRYHQIRKHLLHDGHPIVGDYRYAGRETCARWNDRFQLQERMLLQCREMTFLHPASKEEITVTAPEEDCFRLPR